MLLGACGADVVRMGCGLGSGLFWALPPTLWTSSSPIWRMAKLSCERLCSHHPPQRRPWHSLVVMGPRAEAAGEGRRPALPWPRAEL